jgi:quercetin dioxygenase-like cupin family protein
MTVPVRRVITGHDRAGRAHVVVDQLASRTSMLRPGANAALIWTTEGFPATNDLAEDGAQRSVGTALDNGTVFRVIDYAPGVTPRRHRTHSIDYGVVISGEIWMQLDEGEEVLLRAGDVLVQRGTIHNWVNRSNGVCRIAFVLIAAAPVAFERGLLPAEG